MKTLTAAIIAAAAALGAQTASPADAGIPQSARARHQPLGDMVRPLPQRNAGNVVLV